MFTTQIVGEDHKISFAHERSTIPAAPGKEKSKSHQKPFKTICLVRRLSDGAVVAKGIARCMDEIPEIVASPAQAHELYGSRVKKVMKLPTGEYVAILKGDNFDYDAGRKIALRKALVALDTTRPNRKKVWEAMFSFLEGKRLEAEQDLATKTPRVEEL